jgi:hypothetical protein
VVSIEPDLDGDGSILHDVILKGQGAVDLDGDNFDIARLTVDLESGLAFGGTGNTVTFLRVGSGRYQIAVTSGITVTVIGGSLKTSPSGGIVYLQKGETNPTSLIDTSFDDPPLIYWAGSGNSGDTGGVFRIWTCNIHVVDKDGTNLQNAIVDCEDTDGTAVWTAGSVTTAADGTITEQNITQHRYYWTTSQQTKDYNDHKFTISKDGYKKVIINGVTVSAAINWRIELQQLQLNEMTEDSFLIEEAEKYVKRDW